MDDPPLQKIAIPGPTLASLIQRFSTSPSSSLHGLLFGHVTLLTPLTLTDDDSSTSTATTTTLLATVTSFISSSSFFDSSNSVNPSSLRHLIPPNHHLIGWFSSRRKTPLRPSMREFSLSHSLSSLSSFSSPINNSTSQFNPSIFILFASPPTQTDQSLLHIHTHEFRAYQFRCGTMSFETKSIDVVNIGPAFRGHYESFSPNSRFPVLDCGAVGGSPMREDGGDERLCRMKEIAMDQRELDSCAEGFEVGRLSRMVGLEAKSYTEGLEELYGKMLVKIENLTRLVDQSSAKVLEQENYNRKLKQKILRSSASE